MKVKNVNTQITFENCLGDWFVTVDLTDAHVAINPDHWQFLRFAYEYMHLNIVPVLPEPLPNVSRQHWQSLESFSLSGRLESDSKLRRASHRTTVSDSESLGFSVNFQKSSLNPSQHCVSVKLHYWTILQLAA